MLTISHRSEYGSSTHPRCGIVSEKPANNTSPIQIQHVLPQVIEATNRVIVSNADWDGLLLTNGTLLSIQNMTWNGKLGFQEPPSTPVIVNVPDLHNYQGGYQGEMGKQHYERGLLW